jgi:CheY-like chemotaxis protein
MSYNSEKEEIRVLLVGYDSLLIEIEKKCLELEGGLYIATASSNDEALVKIEKTTPDVIICDFDKLEIDCFELLTNLRSKGNTTPFIAFSYDYEKEQVATAYKSGVNGFIKKSGDISEIYFALKNCILSVIGARTLVKH